MSVPGVTQSASLAQSIPDQSSPELNYEYVNGGFYYTFAHSDRGRAFVSLPGFSLTQVQQLIEGKMERSMCFPPENFEGSQSFGFTHGWQVDQYKVGIVAEDGVLCCTVYNETGEEIYEEEILQTDGNNEPLPAGEIYCKYLRLTPIISSEKKVSFLVHPKEGDDHVPTWEWGDKTLSLLKEDGQFTWRLFDRATETTRRIAFANTWLENPDESFFEEHFYNELPSRVCPRSLLTREHVQVGQLLESTSDRVLKQVLIRRITRLFQSYFLKICFKQADPLEPLLFRPSIACISTQSRLDPKITVNASRWAVTLINSQPPCLKWPHGHAVLLIEIVEDHQYHMMKADLKVGGSITGALVGTSPGKVDYKEVSPPYHYHSKTETWSLSRSNIEGMIAEIKEEISRQEQGEIPVLFSGYGHGTVLTPSSSSLSSSASESVENCLTWAINKLLLHGAKIYHPSDGIFMNRPIEYISSYEEAREKAIKKKREIASMLLTAQGESIDPQNIEILPLRERPNDTHHGLRERLELRMVMFGVYLVAKLINRQT